MDPLTSPRNGLARTGAGGRASDGQSRIAPEGVTAAAGTGKREGPHRHRGPLTGDSALDPGERPGGTVNRERCPQCVSGEDH